MTGRSHARVATDRPHRYAKQLAAHLGRRINTTWDEESGQGRLAFPNGTGTLTAIPGTLLLTVESSAQNLAALEDVVGRHLVRFGLKDELVVQWRRDHTTAEVAQRHRADAPTDTRAGQEHDHER
ncbi:DUF2218 domain-containing protein [Streptomyces sp. NPDC048434]|uniref:DUF2218 domain-containing protein n=1 Tax=Streptomyces sp. NPDC048434 TaxID=3365549 RepID=UPI003719D0F6